MGWLLGWRDEDSAILGGTGDSVGWVLVRFIADDLVRKLETRLLVGSEDRCCFDA